MNNGHTSIITTYLRISLGTNINMGGVTRAMKIPNGLQPFTENISRVHAHKKL